MPEPAFIARLKANEACTVYRPAPEAEVKRWRRGLRVKIPDDFILFLRSCGYAEIGPDVLYGLGPDVVDATSVEINSVIEHVEAEPQMRAEYIPLMNDGAGNYYCLDTTRTKKGTCPIVFWDHEHPKGDMQKGKLVSKSFARWVEGLIDKAE